MPTLDELLAQLRNTTATPGPLNAKELSFRKNIAELPWYKEYVSQYGEKPDISKNADYDYRAAMAAGALPQRDPYDNNRYHWASGNDTKTFKKPQHPTLWKERYMQLTGKNPDAEGATETDFFEMLKNMVSAK